MRREARQLAGLSLFLAERELGFPALLWGNFHPTEEVESLKMQLRRYVELYDCGWMAIQSASIQPEGSWRQAIPLRYGG